MLPRRASAEHRRGARGRDESARFGRRLRRGQVRELFGVRLQVREEALELLLHCVHLLTHVQNYLDAREVHAEVARQTQDDFQAFEV